MSMTIVLWVAKPALVLGQINQDELRKFQGSWKLISAEMDGKKVKDEHVKKSMIAFKDSSVKIFVPHQHGDTIQSNFTKIDNSVTPHIMAWVRDNGPNTGKTMQAIYKFDSPDILHVCFDPKLVKLPGKFGTDPGSGLILQTWNLVK